MELRFSLAAHEAVQAHEALAAALTSAHVAIAEPILERAGPNPPRGLVAALVRRSEEHGRTRGRGASESPLLIELIRDHDPIVADHAMALLVGQSRRVDSFSEPAAARTELSAELEHQLVWRVAAALRQYLIGTHRLDPVAADQAIVAASESLLGRYDEGDALEARAMRLARRLQTLRRLDDELVRRALSEGSFPLFLASLAVRASVGQAETWEIVSDPKGRGRVFLLKAGDVERTSAASILLELASSEEDVPSQVDLFDVTDIAAAQDALRLWRFDPSYRESIAELSA
jgi:uncharacterized protein (DUF2336 family)